MLQIKVIGPVAVDFGASRSDRAIFVVWYRETAFRNIKWSRWLVLRLGWPPVRYLAHFLRDD